jgi:hypothetical protein
MVDESILNKIRVLLAMAEHPNSNEHEAAIALERAQEILLQYNLTRAEVVSETSSNLPPEIGMVDGHEDTGFTWKRILLNSIAKATLCDVIVERGRGRWHIIGTRDNTSVSLEMYHWVILQLDEIAIRSFKEYRKIGGHEHGLTWKLGFYRGAIKIIRERLSKPYEEFSKGTGFALVVYNDKMIEKALDKTFPNRHNFKESQVRSNAGWNAGCAAGRKVTLTPAKKLASTLVLGCGK